MRVLALGMQGNKTGRLSLGFLLARSLGGWEGCPPPRHSSPPTIDLLWSPGRLLQRDAEPLESLLVSGTEIALPRLKRRASADLQGLSIQGKRPPLLLGLARRSDQWLVARLMARPATNSITDPSPEEAEARVAAAAADEGREDLSETSRVPQVHVFRRLDTVPLRSGTVVTGARKST